MARGCAGNAQGFAGWLRLAAGLLVLLVGFGRGFATLHVALVPHRVCETHGVTEHGASPASSFTGTSGGLFGGASHAPAAEGGALLLDLDHESCELAFRDEPPRASGFEAIPTRLSPELDGPRMSVAPSNGSGDVIAYAPKLSPPVTGAPGRTPSFPARTSA